MPSVRNLFSALLLASLLPLQMVSAQDLSARPHQGGETALRFGEFFKLPIGPKGLEASAKLMDLDGRPVRMVGYMARQDGETAVPGLFILTPVPVTLGDEDESFADDLPASVLYVHLAGAGQQSPVRNLPGLLAVHGTLELGPKQEIDGRTSFVRLRLEGAPVPVEGTPVAASGH